MDFPQQYIFTATTGTEIGANWTDDSKAWDGEQDTYAYRTVSTSGESTKWLQGKTLEHSGGGDPYDWPDEFDSVEIGIMLPDSITFGSALIYMSAVIDGTPSSFVNLGLMQKPNQIMSTTISTGETLNKSFIENDLEIRVYAQTFFGTQEVRIAKFIAIGNKDIDNPITCYYTSNSQTSTSDETWSNLSDSTNGNETSSTSVDVNFELTSEVISYTANNNTEDTGEIVRVMVGVVCLNEDYNGTSKNTLSMQPIFSWPSTGVTTTFTSTEVGGTSLDDVIWFNITPNNTWDWDEIDNLDIKVWVDGEEEYGGECDIYGVYLKIFYSSGGNHGLKVWDSSGDVILDLDTKLSRLLYTTEASTGVDGSYTILDGAYGMLDNDEFVGFAFALEPKKAAHNVEVSRIKGTDDILVEWTAVTSIFGSSSSLGIYSSKSLIIAMAW